MDIYKNTIKQCDEKIKRFNKKINVFSFARLILFVTIITCLYEGVANKSYLLFICVCISIAIFAVIYVLDSGLKTRRSYENEKRKFCQEEMDLAENKYIERDEGTCFIDTEHSFSYDLDLFGKQSLYYYLNRTATAMGKNALAGRLKSPSINISQIVSD